MRPSPYKKSSASIQESASDATVKIHNMSGLGSFVDMDFAQDEYERPRAEEMLLVRVVDPAQYATYYLANHHPLFISTAHRVTVATALASATSLSLLSDAHSSSSTESLLSTAARALHGHRDSVDLEDTPKLSSSSAARAPSWIRQIDDALGVDLLVDSPVSEAFSGLGVFRLSESPTITLTDADANTDLGHHHPHHPTSSATEKKARRASSVEYSYATHHAQGQVQVGPPRMRKDSLPRKLATKLGRGLKDFFNTAAPPPVPPVPAVAQHLHLAPPPMRRAMSSQP